jgi:hypothetical protein
MPAEVRLRTIGACSLQDGKRVGGVTRSAGNPSNGFAGSQKVSGSREPKLRNYFEITNRVPSGAAIASASPGLEHPAFSRTYGHDPRTFDCHAGTIEAGRRRDTDRSLCVRWRVSRPVDLRGMRPAGCVGGQVCHGRGRQRLGKNGSQRSCHCWLASSGNLVHGVHCWASQQWRPNLSVQHGRSTRVLRAPPDGGPHPLWRAPRGRRVNI